MKYVIISVRNEWRMNFYTRLEKNMNKLGCLMVYFTYQYSVYKELKKIVSDKNKVVFINSKGIKNYNQIDYENEREYRMGWDEKRVITLYSAVMKELKSYDASEIECLFTWNGYSVIDRAFSDFANEMRVKKLNFELSNIKNKIFVDREGANARSYVYRCPEILDKYPIDKERFDSWKAVYVQDKYKQTTVKQAKRMSFLEKSKKYIYDMLGVLYYGGISCHDDLFVVLNRNFKRFIREKKFANIAVPFDYKNKKYVFFPLQVSNDNQMMFNGDISMYDAVIEALKVAKENNSCLVIKPHPVEPAPPCLEKILKLQENNDIVITNENTFSLIENADTIVTINSTVGMEALILGKKLKVLGRAIYKNFDEKRLIQYITEYLIPVDYWGREEVSVDNIKKILARAEEV